MKLVLVIVAGCWFSASSAHAQSPVPEIGSSGVPAMSKNDPRLDRIRERINALEPQLVDYSYFKSKLSGISRPRRAAAFFVKVTKPSGHGMVYSYGYNWSDGNYGSQSAYQAHEKWPLREKLQKAKS